MTDIIQLDPDYITSVTSTTPKAMLLAIAADVAVAIRATAALKRDGYAKKKKNQTSPDHKKFRDGILTTVWLFCDPLPAGRVFEVTEYSLEFVQDWALKTLKDAGVTNDDFVEAQRWWNRKIAPVRMVA